jgi:nitrogen fixation protein NifU and related proteins
VPSRSAARGYTLPQTMALYTATTVDHFQNPRNVGRLADADAVGHVDDRATDTTVTLYLKMSHGRVERATFRTFGCSACIAASSISTELLAGRSPEESQEVTAAALDTALGGLPAEKRYCLDLVAEAVRRAVQALTDAET